MGRDGLVEWEMMESFDAYFSDTVSFAGLLVGNYFITQKRISPSRFDTDYESKIYMISKEDYEANDCHNIDCIANGLFNDNTYLRYGDDPDYCCRNGKEETVIYSTFSSWTDGYWGYTHVNHIDRGGFWAVQLNGMGPDGAIYWTEHSGVYAPTLASVAEYYFIDIIRYEEEYYDSLLQPYKIVDPCTADYISRWRPVWDNLRVFTTTQTATTILTNVEAMIRGY